MNKKMLISTILIIISLSLFSGCSLIEKEVSDADYLNPVTLEQVVEKIDKKETFNFVLGNDSCPACAIYKEELQKFHKEEDYKFDYMTYGPDTDNEVFFKLITETLGENPEMLSTPTTYFIVDGKIAAKEVGAIKTDDIKVYSEYYK